MALSGIRQPLAQRSTPCTMPHRRSRQQKRVAYSRPVITMILCTAYPVTMNSMVWAAMTGSTVVKVTIFCPAVKAAIPIRLTQVMVRILLKIKAMPTSETAIRSILAKGCWRKMPSYNVATMIYSSPSKTVMIASPSGAIFLTASLRWIALTFPMAPPGIKR